MPWNKVTQMEELNRFVILAQTDRFTLTDLCEQFGISRKTGHKHLARYAASGLPGLVPRSHRPRHFPQRTDEAVEQLILAERRLHRTWTRLEARGKRRTLIAVAAARELAGFCWAITQIE